MPRDPQTLSQVKNALKAISELAPGHAVELRIPPYSAIQCCEGPKHTRGTPPNVVEMGAEQFFGLLNGSLRWTDGVADGSITASGERSDLSALFEQAARTIRITK